MMINGKNVYNSRTFAHVPISNDCMLMGMDGQRNSIILCWSLIIDSLKSCIWQLKCVPHITKRNIHVVFHVWKLFLHDPK